MQVLKFLDATLVLTSDVYIIYSECMLVTASVSENRFTRSSTQYLFNVLHLLLIYDYRLSKVLIHLVHQPNMEIPHCKCCNIVLIKNLTVPLLVYFQE